MQNVQAIKRPVDNKVSRTLMTAIVVLLSLILAMVATARLLGMEPVAKPASGPILAERVLFLESSIAGEVQVTGQDGETIAHLPDGKGVFISTIHRVVKRERLRFQVDPNGPLHLRRRAGNVLSLYDPLTEQSITLKGFGRDNIAAFAKLLP
ncbi:MAG: photosynthetic complex assembly protein PuhC [Pseudomonadota bacterium]